MELSIQFSSETMRYQQSTAQQYSTQYSTLYSRQYSTLYSRQYSTQYSTLYSTLYSTQYSTQYILLPQALTVTPLVWIFLAIISVLVLMIVLIGLVLRARCSKSSRQKAKFVRASEGHNTLLKEEERVNSRGNNPDLIPDTGRTIRTRILNLMMIILKV